LYRRHQPPLNHRKIFFIFFYKMHDDTIANIIKRLNLTLSHKITYRDQQINGITMLRSTNRILCKMHYIIEHSVSKLVRDVIYITSIDMNPIGIIERKRRELIDRTSSPALSDISDVSVSSNTPTPIITDLEGITEKMKSTLLIILTIYPILIYKRADSSTNSCRDYIKIDRGTVDDIFIDLGFKKAHEFPDCVECPIVAYSIFAEKALKNIGIF
jgi:hypothetical protein